MPAETIVVGVDRPDGTERVTIQADRIDRDRDGTVRCYEDGQEIATFYDAVYAVRDANLAE